MKLGSYLGKGFLVNTLYLVSKLVFPVFGCTPHGSIGSLVLGSFYPLTGNPD